MSDLDEIRRSFDMHYRRRALMEAREDGWKAGYDAARKQAECEVDRVTDDDLDVAWSDEVSSQWTVARRVIRQRIRNMTPEVNGE